MILRLNSRNTEVKQLQKFLNSPADGIFGKGTEEAVKNWQLANHLIPDGIVGPNTWDAMGIATTDAFEKTYTTQNGLIVNRHFLPSHEYKKGPTNPEWVFIHHTAGWNNPFKTIDNWSNDTRGAICTEFTLGGPKVSDGSVDYDGVTVQAFPEGNYGYHLGRNGSRTMHKNSVGMELCNFGYIINGRTYAGTVAKESQIVTLPKPFRGHLTWHRYSNTQIESLQKWLLFIGERDNIDIRAGLPTLVKSLGADAFEFNEDAFYGRVKGTWTHTNTRKDKFDMFPQPELLDMLVSL